MLGSVVRVASGSGSGSGSLRNVRGESSMVSRALHVVAGTRSSLAHGQAAQCRRCYGTALPGPKSPHNYYAQGGHASPTVAPSGIGSVNGGGRSSKVEWRQYSSMTNSNTGVKQHVPVIRSLSQLRRWRRQARDEGLEVGVVPTMGALHQGHLDLVKASLQRHPLTVMTLFVNPMQFAPTEDLASYPRTLERDLDLLRTLLPPNPSSSLRGLGVSESDGSRPPLPTAPTGGASDIVRGLGVSEHERAALPDSPQALGSLVVFNPGPDVMYPLKGDLQDLKQKRGVEVDVKGWGDVMEGASRPQFFKGVATVCTKLFNAVEPDHAYFGQKDIQQALLLKIMLQDLLLAHPLPDNMHILPTTRAADGLALSSRNAYLSPAERAVAPTLHRALNAGRDLYRSATTTPSTSTGAGTTGEDIVSAATEVILAESQRLLDEGAEAEIKLDYVEVFDKHTFEPIRGKVESGREMVIAGAMWVGKTRLIDNLLLGWGEGWEV